MREHPPPICTYLEPFQAQYITACRAHISSLALAWISYLCCSSCSYQAACCALATPDHVHCCSPCSVVYCRALRLSSTQVFQRLSTYLPCGFLALWSLPGRCHLDYRPLIFTNRPGSHRDVGTTRYSTSWPNRSVDFPPACVRPLHHHGEAETLEPCVSWAT